MSHSQPNLAWIHSAYTPGLVSVIVPSFNRAHMLTQTMESVWSQTYRPIELIVVDDGSTDGTDRIVARWRDQHDREEGFQLRYFSKTNGGVSSARNMGLCHSRGEFIQYLDSDDLLHGQKCEIQVAYLREHDDIDFVYSSTFSFRDAPVDGTFFTGYPKAEPLLAFLRDQVWWTAGGIYRRRLCDKIGCWNESLYCWEDWEYHCRACLETQKIRFIPGVLSFYRCQQTNQITTSAHTGAGVMAHYEAIRSVRDLISAHSQLDSKTRKALCRAYFHAARHAAKIGDEALYKDIMSDAHDSLGPVRCNPLLLSLRFLACVIGLNAAGTSLEWCIGSTCHLRRRLRCARSV